MTTNEAAWAGPAGALFATLGQEFRLKILHHLRNGALSGNQLVNRVGATKGLLQAHLVRLQQDNLISREGTGGKAVYALTSDPVLAILSEAERLFRKS